MAARAPAEAEVAIESLFPADEWLVIPGTRIGLPLSVIRPCRCGCTKFVAVACSPRSADIRIACYDCYHEPRNRMQRKGDVQFASLNVNEKAFTHVRSFPRFSTV